VDVIEVLLYREGDSIPFLDWLESLRDLQAISAIRARINRIRLGNFGDSKPVGEGVEELRIHLGPGYRVYFARERALLVILLCGGTKRTQARDIARAQRYWKRYLNAKSNS
jgi:putative addiction module killer protein